MSLPVHGLQADRIWSAFIYFGSLNRRMLFDLCEYEGALEAKRAQFFREVVGSILASGDPNYASDYAYRLRSKHPATKEDFQEILAAACHSRSASALTEFCKIVEALHASHIYQVVIPYLCSQQRYDDAFTMHNFLIRRKDYPLTFQVIEPLVKHIAASGTDLPTFRQSLQHHGLSYDAQVRVLHEHERNLCRGFPADHVDELRNKTFGVRPKTLSDGFIARLFATSSLSFNLILKGLHMVGTKSIGPLAVQQMALRAGNPATLWEYFEQLRKHDIDTGGSAFVRVVRKLVMENRGANSALLSSIMSSDQHPDVFEDQDLQQKLLENFVHVQDWQEVNRTLAIMTTDDGLLSGGTCQERMHAESEAAANLLLHTTLSKCNWTETTILLSRMIRHGFAVNRATVHDMFNLILVKRAKGSKPVSKMGFDDTAFLIRCLQLALRSGGYDSPKLWREPIRRLGLLRRWDDLEKTVSWLAAWYNPANIPGPLSFNPTGPTWDDPPRRDVSSSSSRARALKTIFENGMQQAIVEWGFIADPPIQDPQAASALKQSPELRSLGQSHDWTRGLKLLGRLQSLYGVVLDAPAIRKAIVVRLRNLFSIDGVSRLPANRRLRDANTMPLSHYMKMIVEICGEPMVHGIHSDILLKRRFAHPRAVPYGLRRQRAVLRRPVHRSPVLWLSTRRRPVWWHPVLREEAGQSTGLQCLRAQARSNEAPWVDPSGVARATAEGTVQENAEVSQDMEAKLDTSQDDQSELDGVVMYRDIFNASWEDYQRRRGVSKEED